jgi:hypothetical protein
MRGKEREGNTWDYIVIETKRRNYVKIEKVNYIEC